MPPDALAAGDMTDRTSPKKAYARPELTKWGTLTDLTKTDWTAMDVDMRTGSTYRLQSELHGRRRRRRRRRNHQSFD